MTFTITSKTHFIIVLVIKVLHKLSSLLLVMTTVNLVIQILIGNLLNSILLILSGTRKDAQQLNNCVVNSLVSHGSTRPFSLPLQTILSWEFVEMIVVWSQDTLYIIYRSGCTGDFICHHWAEYLEYDLNAYLFLTDSTPSLFCLGSTPSFMWMIYEVVYMKRKR